MKIVTTAIAALLLCGCSTPFPRATYPSLVLPPSDSPRSNGSSIVLNRLSANPLVQNGEAYEKISLKLPDNIRKIEVPTGTIIQRSSDSRQTDIYLEKSLGWMGHPGEPVSIESERKKMGAAIKIQGDVLLLSFFGAWSSFEGGSAISAVAAVPPGIKISYRKRLNFENNDKWQGSDRFRPESWFILPTHPDPERGYKTHSKTSE